MFYEMWYMYVLNNKSCIYNNLICVVTRLYDKCHVRTCIKHHAHFGINQNKSVWMFFCFQSIKNTFFKNAINIISTCVQLSHGTCKCIWFVLFLCDSVHNAYHVYFGNMHTLGKPELSENRTIRPVPRPSGLQRVYCTLHGPLPFDDV